MYDSLYILQKKKEDTNTINKTKVLWILANCGHTSLMVFWWKLAFYLLQVDVAVKCLKISRDAAFLQLQLDFTKEANGMSRLDHPNIIKLYGVVLSTPLMLVSESTCNLVLALILLSSFCPYHQYFPLFSPFIFVFHFQFSFPFVSSPLP